MTILSLLDEEEAETLFNFVKGINHPDIRIAEIGVSQGATSSRIANIIKDNHGIVFAIDSWENENDFSTAMKLLSFFKDTVIPIKGKSHLIAPMFADRVFDLVFLDADHHYSFIKQDIELWMPKVKRGGILCGHDCEKKFTDYNKVDQEAIELHKEDDKPGFSCHPGVIKALYDIFHDDYKTLIKRIWYKEIS